MPTAPRIKGKGTKIAYKVMGVPPNIRSVQTEAQKRINYKLNIEETQRVK